MARNLAYRTDQLARFFADHRNRWSGLYPSERWVFERLGAASGGLGSVLDVGCALGGLRHALAERFRLDAYVGVDINPQAIAAAREDAGGSPVPARFECGDVVEMGAIAGEPFDLVASLSCADWNLDTSGIIEACWRRVAPGGHFVISVRLTPDAGINDFARSYQYIVSDASDLESCERANYVVFNGSEFLRLLAALTPPPTGVLGYGYWGPPSRTAVTPYERLVFAVFAARRAGGTASGPSCELHLPLDLLAGVSGRPA